MPRTKPFDSVWQTLKYYEIELLALFGIILGVTMLVLSVTKASPKRDYPTIVLEGCEYFETRISLTHKGNCKTCISRLNNLFNHKSGDNLP